MELITRLNTMGRQFISIFLLLVVTDGFSDVGAGNFIEGVLRTIIPDCIMGAESTDFYVYNSDNPSGVIVNMNSEKIPLKKNASIVFLIHGFTADGNSTRWFKLIQCWLEKHSVNIIAVDWKNGSCTSGGIPLTRLLGYPSAVKNTRVVGEYVAEFIMKLIGECEVKFDDILIVGHSLGAHVGAFCSKHLQKNNFGTLCEIWGLDPAGPEFKSNDCQDRICATDAKCVQIFHTSVTYGTYEAIGHKDFYFNGGLNQPNCPVLNRASCSHIGAIEYLIHIICGPDCKYVGKKWNKSDPAPTTSECSEDTCSKPGLLACQSGLNGTYYVDTSKLPACCVTFTSPYQPLLEK